MYSRGVLRNGGLVSHLAESGEEYGRNRHTHYTSPANSGLEGQCPLLRAQVSRLSQPVPSPVRVTESLNSQCDLFLLRPLAAVVWTHPSLEHMSLPVHLLSFPFFNMHKET